MSHDDFDFEPVRGLPALLPKDEHLLWQGSPEWKSLAVRAYHVRKVAAYFLLLVLWRVGVGLANGHTASDVLVSCVFLMALGGIAIGVLSSLAYFNARSTVYSITSRRVLLRHGVAVPLTMDIPFKLIDNAGLRNFKDNTGDIALGLAETQRIGYLITWPHLRPGKITRPQPCLRAVLDATRVAETLSAALAAEAGTHPVQVEVPVSGANGQRPRVLEPLTAGPVAAGPRSAAAA